MVSDTTLNEMESDIELNKVMYDPALIKIARRRAGAKLGFYIHAFIFVATNLMLIWVWLLSGQGPWFLLVLVFWGAGLALHGGIAFEGLHVINSMTERELDKLSQEGDAMSQQEALMRRQEDDTTSKRKF